MKRKMVNNNDEHSVEVHEIMGEQANWMVRWGASVLVMIVLVMIGVFFLIRYPVFVKVPIVATTPKAPIGAVAGEAVVSKPLYDQIKIGQEARVTALASADLAGIGRVDAKLSGLRVRLIFAVEADQQMKLLKALQAAGSVKIKTGEKRLISQFRGLFMSK